MAEEAGATDTHQGALWDVAGGVVWALESQGLSSSSKLYSLSHVRNSSPPNVIEPWIVASCIHDSECCMCQY